MKRGILILLTLLLLSPIVITAAEEPAKSPLNTGNLLDKEIEIPEGFQILARVFFGIDDSISISAVIILLAIWFVLFIIITNTLKLMHFFKGGIAWLIGAIVTILIALSGAIKGTAGLILAVGDSFGFIGKWSAGALMFALLVVLIIGFIGSKILKKISDYIEIEEARTEGEKTGENLSLLKILTQRFKKK